jgi:hypothetical protein
MLGQRFTQGLVDGGSVVVAGGDLHAGLHLRLAFYDATAIVVAKEIDGVDVAVFDAVVPAGAGLARLRHQGKLSLVAQLREQKLGDAAVDAAFIVNVDDAGFAVLTQCAAQLRALVEAGPVSPAAEIELSSASLHAVWPLETAAAVVSLWERIVNLRVAG